MHRALPQREDFPVGERWCPCKAGSARAPALVLRNCRGAPLAAELPARVKGKEKKELHLALLQNKTKGILTGLSGEQTHPIFWQKKNIAPPPRRPQRKKRKKKKPELPSCLAQSRSWTLPLAGGGPGTGRRLNCLKLLLISTFLLARLTAATRKLICCYEMKIWGFDSIHSNLGRHINWVLYVFVFWAFVHLFGIDGS